MPKAKTPLPSLEAVHLSRVRAAAQVAEAIVHLQQARDLLVAAGAQRTADKVRLALSSAQGAKRNADNRAWRD